MQGVNQTVDIPRPWEQLSLARVEGVVLVIGPPDVGKTTFARYLFQRLCGRGRPVAYLDGDPGQSTLGPPTTMTLALGLPDETVFPPRGRVWRSFVGAVSPWRHMLPLLTGAHRLVQAAQKAGAATVVYDTSGLVQAAQGGPALKLAKIDLLRPSVVFALQHRGELEPLLVPLRRSRRVRVVDVPPSPARQIRAVPDRQAHRAAQFGRYFAAARSLPVNWSHLAVFPDPQFAPNRLVALEDADGFTRGLGLVVEHNVRARQVTLLTPLDRLEEIDALCLGDVLLDPHTYRDRRLENRPPGRG